MLDKYRDELEKKHNFIAQGKSAGNENRRWHGTMRDCNIGNPGEKRAKFCRSSNCSICSIFQSSFDLIKFGQHTNFGKFGEAIYTSATSSKASDYITERSGPYHSFILAKVALGRCKTLTVQDTTLRAAPPGYDSVIGEPGKDLNYDEA